MLLRLPHLKPLTAAPVEDACCLWPGLPAEGGLPGSYWQPDDYPLAPEEASLIYAELAGLRIAELETIRLALNMHKLNDERDLAGEMADLASFTGQAPRLSASEISRQQAQKTLLWAWLMEEQAAEISALEESCNAAEQRISGLFAESGAIWKLPASPVPVCSWQTILACAAWFLPYDIAIMAEGEMLENMAENCDFAPVGDGSLLHECAAPIWQVLGRSRPYHGCDARLAENINTNRRWFGWIQP